MLRPRVGRLAAPDVVRQRRRLHRRGRRRDRRGDRLRGERRRRRRWLAPRSWPVGGRLVHVSTDYVFDGAADRPYAVDAPTGPRLGLRPDQAGRRAGGRGWPPETRLRGPHRLGVRRGTAATSSGPWSGWRRKRDDRRRRRRPARLADLVGRPGPRASSRWSGPASRPACYHCTNTGETTWYGFARAVFEELGADPERVQPTTTDDVPAAGAPAGLLGAVRCRVAGGRAAGDAGLAQRVAPGVRRIGSRLRRQAGERHDRAGDSGRYRAADVSEAASGSPMSQPACCNTAA